MIDLNDFPQLKQSGWIVTSAPTTRYNCIAWAAGDDTNWWWPDADGYWPEAKPSPAGVAAFVKMFAKFGYGPCPNGDYELMLEKVAIYIDAPDSPSHAARQIEQGLWTSKVGPSEDITHTLAGLEGPCYGTVVCFLGRRASMRQVGGRLLHRLFAAVRAMSARRDSLSVAFLASPPFWPPLRPRFTASGFFATPPGG